VIDELQIGTDLQAAMILALLDGADTSRTNRAAQAAFAALQTPEDAAWYGLTRFASFPVVRRPAGSGIRIVYHQG
jgi:hypothetical protein